MGILRTVTAAPAAATETVVVIENGEPRNLDEIIKEIFILCLRTNKSVSRLCRHLGIGRSTMYRHMAERGLEAPPAAEREAAPRGSDVIQPHPHRGDCEVTPEWAMSVSQQEGKQYRRIAVFYSAHDMRSWAHLNVSSHMRPGPERDLFLRNINYYIDNLNPTCSGDNLGFRLTRLI